MPTLSIRDGSVDYVGSMYVIVTSVLAILTSLLLFEASREAILHLVTVSGLARSGVLFVVAVVVIVIATFVQRCGHRRLQRLGVSSAVSGGYAEPYKLT